MNSDMLPEETRNAAELVSAVSGELVTTGSAGLDEMLGGGIPAGSTVFVCGSTGSGKTILAQQMAFANSARDINVVYLYLAGFSESIANRVRSLMQFDTFDRSAFNVSVNYRDVLPVIRSAQSTDVLSSLAVLLERHKATVLIIDSIRIMLEKLEEFNRGQETLRRMTEFVSDENLVALLVGQYTQEDIVKEPQFAFADGVILLTAPYESPDGKRYLRIMKMRGADHSSAARRFRISSSGLIVLPDADSGTQAEPQVA